ncbi:MAG: patatin-like phospholipase family protein [Candidatus Pelagadaptatus aseana]
MMKNKRPVVGIALGSGASRGWAHIGIINALEKMGIVPQVVTGTSIGSLVGAAYAAGNMGKLESWVCALTKREISRFFEFGTSLSGFVHRERFNDFLNSNIATDAQLIEELPITYGSVATDLKSGREEWLSSGSVLKSIWASAALPGLFPAVSHEDRWLVDGGLVNPVPVSLCRALGADFVIAVNLNDGLVGKHFDKPKQASPEEVAGGNKFANFIREYTGSLFNGESDSKQPPNVFDAIAGTINITQDRITRSRLAGDPPDLLLSPKLAHIDLLEFHRAGEAILEGENCVKRLEEEIYYVLGNSF